MLRCCVAVMLRQRFGGIKIKLYLCTRLSEDQHTEKRESRFLDTSYKANPLFPSSSGLWISSTSSRRASRTWRRNSLSAKSSMSIIVINS